MGILAPIPRRRNRESAVSILTKVLQSIGSVIDEREARKEKETRPFAERAARRTKETKGFHEKLMEESRKRGEFEIGGPLFKGLEKSGKATRALARDVVREGNIEIVDGVPVFIRRDAGVKGRGITRGGKPTDAQILRQKWLSVFDEKMLPEQNENALPIRALRVLLEDSQPSEVGRILESVQEVLPKSVANDPDVLDAAADYIEANPTFFFKAPADETRTGISLKDRFRALLGGAKRFFTEEPPPVSVSDELGVKDPDLIKLIDELGLE